MILLGEFDPTTSGHVDIQQMQVGGRIGIWNESDVLLRFSLGSFASFYGAPWQSRIVTVTGATNRLEWVVQGSLSSNSPPIQKLLIEYYGPEEPIHEVATSMVRQANLGNSVPVGTTATDIVNSGNASGTKIVQAKVLAEVQTAVDWTNDAILKNGNAAHPGHVEFDNNTIFSDGSGNMTMNQMIANSVAVFNSSLFTDLSLTSTKPGSLSGAANVYEVFTGAGFKGTRIELVGFNTGGNVDLPLVNPYIFQCWCFVGDLNGGNMQLILGGVTQNINVITGLAALGGTATNSTDIRSFSIGPLRTSAGFDTIRLRPTTGVTTSTILLIGN